MRLGEVIQKRDYYLRCLMETSGLMKQASIAKDKFTNAENEKRIVGLLNLFNEYYESYQRYSLLVSRTEASAMIPLDDGSEVSIKDAITVRDSMITRYECYKSILDKLISEAGNFVCIDMETLSNAVLDYHEDIMGINIKIEHALWESEV